MKRSQQSTEKDEMSSEPTGGPGERKTETILVFIHLLLASVLGYGAWLVCVILSEVSGR